MEIEVIDSSIGGSHESASSSSNTYRVHKGYVYVSRRLLNAVGIQFA